MKKQRILRRELGSIITESSEFELIQFDGSFYCNPIKTESNYNKLFNEVNQLKEMANTLGIVVLKIKGLIKLTPLLKSYSPDYLSTDVITTSTKSKKLKEQRIENGGIDKVKDQFRYLTLLSMDWADSNVFPIASRYGTSDNLLEHYDRSNLMEFSHRNLMRKDYITLTNSNITQENIEEMNTIDENEISSKDALEIINDIESKYPEVTPKSSEFLKIKERLETSDASEKFTISKLLGEDGIDDLLNVSNHHFTIVIGKSDIVVNELKNINNRFNEWHNINFAFADLIDKNPLTQYVKDNLMGDEWDEILQYQNKLIGKAEEYRILPVLALAIFSKSHFTKNTNSICDNFASLALFMEGKAKSTKKGGNYGVAVIPDLVTENTKLSKSLVKHLYSSEVKGELNKLKVRLKDLANFVDKNKYDVSKITELIHPTFGIPLYPIYAAILVNDNKMFNKWDDEGCTLNAKRLIQTFISVFFGDDVFKIDKKAKKVTISAKGQFAGMISLKNDTTKPTDTRGSKSHFGRSHHFTDKELINTFVEKFNKITGNQGSNVKATQSEIEMFQEMGIESLEYFEMDSSGNAQPVGWDSDGDPLTGTSLEHLIDTNHHALVLRYLGNNKNAGASDKVIQLESDWYDRQADLQESKFAKKYKNELILNTTVASLRYIAEQKRKEGK